MLNKGVLVPIQQLPTSTNPVKIVPCQKLWFFNSFCIICIRFIVHVLIHSYFLH